MPPSVPMKVLPSDTTQHVNVVPPSVPNEVLPSATTRQVNVPPSVPMEVLPSATTQHVNVVPSSVPIEVLPSATTQQVNIVPPSVPKKVLPSATTQHVNVVPPSVPMETLPSATTRSIWNLDLGSNLPDDSVVPIDPALVEEYHKELTEAISFEKDDELLEEMNAYAMDLLEEDTSTNTDTILNTPKKMDPKKKDAARKVPSSTKHKKATPETKVPKLEEVRAKKMKKTSKPWKGQTRGSYKPRKKSPKRNLVEEAFVAAGVANLRSLAPKPPPPPPPKSLAEQNPELFEA